MSLMNILPHRRLLAATLAALSLSAFAAVVRPARAHETKCPYCKLDVTQDTATLDNEVALRYGRKRIEYKCVHCALAEAKTEYSGDLSISAPSETKGKPVVITRTGGKWSASPATAVFVAQKVSHRHCQIGYRALTDKAGFDVYVKKNQALLKNAKPLTLAQMVELAR